MPVSANALFHFTKDIDRLKNILSNGFYPRYCMEDKKYLNVLSKQQQDSGCPMVCFCDIPLTSIKNHVQRYGDYGIGINKDRAENLGIYPVTYIVPDSPIIKYLNNSYTALKKYYPKKKKPLKDYIDLDYLHGEALDAFHYLKPYEGKNWKNRSFAGEKICFFDEKEWRYVPSQEVMAFAGVLRFMPREFFLEYEDRNEIDKQLESFALRFDLTDIKYILVQNDKEVSNMVSFIMNLDDVCGKKLSLNSKELLCTRIISMQRIESDF